MAVWTETAGADPAGLDRAVKLIEARGGASALCLLKDGKVLLDRQFGAGPDALFWIFSASKPFVALAVHQLVQTGELALDHPVARYWPDFGRHGKENVTVRHVLRHRSGFSTARGFLGDALAMTDWDASVDALQRTRLRWAPGEVAAYQPIAYGFVLGELVRRITGHGIREVLHDRFFDPLGLTGIHLGLPAAEWGKHVPIRGQGLGGPLTARLVNRRAVREAVIPAAGISTAARDLARCYQALLNGGVLDGVRILDEAAILEARRPSGHGEVDRTIRLPVRWAQGFQLGGIGRPMGALSGPETFGHNGSNCCIAWADPRRRLVFVYLTDLIMAGHAGAHHLGAVGDAVLAACG